MPAGLILRSATDADESAMTRLAATCFGSFQPPEVTAIWRTMRHGETTVVVCDGPDIVGQALYLDLRLTVPGGATLPMAGVSWVAVAPTHRRQGVLTHMLSELHRRMADAAYPIAGLEASEGGIYGRFGYGPATVDQTLRVDRRRAQLRPEVPDPGGVRAVAPDRHREQLVDLYECWRLRTPGGLPSPPALWDEVLADRESARDGGSPFFCLLHTDGFVMYRVHKTETARSVDVTKFVALTDDAFIALWRVLLGMDLMDTVTVYTHLSNPLPYLLADARAVQATAAEDGLWLRIINIPAVLAARTYRADVSAVLDIDSARFRLDVRDGRARCVPTDDTADVTLGIAELGSLYLGVHRASAFATGHRLRCNDLDLLRRLDLAFETEVPAELGYGF